MARDSVTSTGRISATARAVRLIAPTRGTDEPLTRIDKALPSPTADDGERQPLFEMQEREAREDDDPDRPADEFGRRPLSFLSIDTETGWTSWQTRTLPSPALYQLPRPETYGPNGRLMPSDDGEMPTHNLSRFV